MQRGQHEDERERVCCQNEQRDEPEREQRDGLAGEQLVRRRSRAAGRAGGARRSSPAPTSAASAISASTGQSPAAADAGFGRPRSARSATRRSLGSRRTRGRRRARSRAGCAERATAGPKRDAPAAAVREEIDGADEERDQQRREQQLDRPAAHDPHAGPDEARRALRQLEALVERAERAAARRGRAPASCAPSSAAGRSVNASGGRSPAVVSVSAGTPRATNGPCS